MFSVPNDIGNWLSAVVHHWEVVVVTGAIPFLIELLDNLVGWKMPRKLYAVFVSAGLVIAIFLAWRDEHRAADEAVNGKDGKVQAWSKYNECDKERTAKSILADAYSSEVAQQRSRLDNQQSTLDSCVVSLGKTNAPKKLDLNTIQHQLDYDKNADIWKTEFLISSNLSLPAPVDMQLTCDQIVLSTPAPNVTIEPRGFIIGAAAQASNNRVLTTIDNNLSTRELYIVTVYSKKRIFCRAEPARK